MAAHRNIPYESDYAFWLQHYYELKALSKVGFRYDLNEFDPYELEILSYIEIKMRRLENQEMERRTQEIKSKSRRR